jgi:D-alanyl-D-alanine dipeptidase
MIRARLRLICFLVFVTALSCYSQTQSSSETSYRITPVRPVDELRKEALKAQPPREEGNFRRSDLVELVLLDPTFKLDIRYATTDNFLSTALYSQARAFLQRPAAEALVRVNQALRNKGYGLLIYDGYRPWYVTKMFWDAVPGDPEKKKKFVADPTYGSIHNRGCAVDLTLYDLQTGKEIEMPSGYDEMTERAYADYVGGTTKQRTNRQILRAAMEGEGFTVEPTEWWHFNYKNAKEYPILNVKFEDLLASTTPFAPSARAGVDPCSKPTNQMMSNRCADEAANRAEDALQMVYKELLAKAGETSKAGQKIQAAEEQWTAYRDAYLEAMFPEPDKRRHYGSMYSMERSAIRRQFALQHIAELNGLLNRYEH